MNKEHQRTPFWKWIIGYDQPMPEPRTFQPTEEAPKLEPCPDCGREVSTKAASCPQCGRKLKQEQTAIGLLAAIIIGLIIAWILFGSAFN